MVERFIRAEPTAGFRGDAGPGQGTGGDRPREPVSEICQNYARRDLATPHDPISGSASHLRGCVGM